MISTSGTTGNPKYVKLTKQNIDSNTLSVLKYLKINKKDTTITTLPMNYVYGLSIINTHLFVGAKIVLNNYSVLDKKFWSDVNSDFIRFGKTICKPINPNCQVCKLKDICKWNKLNNFA